MGTLSMEVHIGSVGGSVFSAGGVLHFRYKSYLATFRDADFLRLYRARKKKPHCLCDLQISRSLLSNEVKQVTRYYSHGLERGHLPFANGIGGGVTPEGACIATSTSAGDM